MGCRSQAGKLFLATLLVVAPFAHAHGGFDEGRPLGEGSIHLRIVGAPVLVAQAPLRLEVATDLAGPVEARLAHRGAAGAWFALADAGGVRAHDVVFDADGLWRVDVRAGVQLASFDVQVWPAGPSFVEPASDAARRGVIVLGSDEPILLRVLDAEHQPQDAPTDAVAIVAGPGGGSHVPVQARGDLIELRHDWTTRGAFEIEIVSEQAQLAAGSRPPIGILVVAPEEAPVYGIGSRETPLGALAILALVVAMALVGRLTRERP